MMKYCVRRKDTGEFLKLSSGIGTWGTLKEPASSITKRP